MTLFRIPTVLTGDELTDLAFKKAAKITTKKGRKNKLAAEREHGIAKIQSVQNTLGARLKKYETAFPSLNQLHPFYREIIDILLNLDDLRKALGALNWARRKINGVCTKSLGDLKRANSLEEIAKAQRSAYGRVSSVLRQINKQLLFLNAARETLRGLPEIDPELPTVVIAGSPNVGKSMLVKKLSTGKPEVAAYPFTTKRVTVGHIDVAYEKYQVIDTPGLLDSDPTTKKNIEKQAVMAIQHLADLMVFVLDPSEYCGYPLEVQFSLLSRIRKTFPEMPYIVIENKSDLKSTNDELLSVSAMDDIGIDELKEEILESLKEIEENKQETEEVPEELTADEES
jgi:nucleolar GTP-binding protein